MLWKHLLLVRGADEIGVQNRNLSNASQSPNYSTPSTSGKGKSASWHRVESIKALPRMRVRDNLPNSWLVTSPSSDPLHLAKAEASCLTWLTAPECRPPSVSIAKGKKTNPSRRHASAVSLTFRWQAFARAAPASAAAAATLDRERGLVTVTCNVFQSEINCPNKCPAAICSLDLFQKSDSTF